MKQYTDQEVIEILAKYKKRGRVAEIWHRMKRNKGAIFGLVILCVIVVAAIVSGFVLDYDTQVVGLNALEKLQGPSMNHLLGTDGMGRDVLNRIVYGARYSLTIGIVSVTISTVIGVALGAIAGYYGGVVETIVMRCSDIISVIPGILLAMVVVAALGGGFINLMIAIGLAGVPAMIRTARAAVLTVRPQEYIESARAMGLRESAIIFKHVIPNALSPIIVQISLRISGSILQAAALSFLGLGVPAPAPEWGAILSEGRSFIRTAGYLTLFPGVAIMLTVLAFNLLGDGLRDALDPKLKR